MNLVSEHKGRGRFAAVGFAAIAFALLALIAMAGRAQAAETLYWDNYGASPQDVAFANIDGNGGGLLNLGGQKVDDPEGMAYDSVTNRLFVTNNEGSSGPVLAVNLDGSGAASFPAPGAPIDGPEGVAVDPVSRTIYWENTGTTDAIVWAKLDGSAGGV